MDEIATNTGTVHVSATGASSQFLMSNSSGGASDTDRTSHLTQNVLQEPSGAGEETVSPMVYQDMAVMVEETGGRHGNTREEQGPLDNRLHRLLLVSSKIRNSSVMKNALLPNVIFVQYKYDSSSLESILGKSAL